MQVKKRLNYKKNFYHSFKDDMTIFVCFFFIFGKTGSWKLEENKNFKNSIPKKIDRAQETPKNETMKQFEKENSKTSSKCYFSKIIQHINKYTPNSRFKQEVSERNKPVSCRESEKIP